jgi:hypothetical protein
MGAGKHLERLAAAVMTDRIHWYSAGRRDQ